MVREPPGAVREPPGAARSLGRDVEPPRPETAGAPGPDLSALTPRELDVLDLVARGHDDAAIASLLGLSPRTVRNHLNSVFSKLNLTYRPQAVVLAREAGLGSGPPRYAGRESHAARPRQDARPRRDAR